MAYVEMDSSFTSRGVNVGFSGGEKKRNEIFHMAMLEPKLAILDETDSGLDVDALRVVAGGINRLKTPENATIVITHYQRLLDYILPDYIHVIYKGRIIKSAGREMCIRDRCWIDRLFGCGGFASGQLRGICTKKGLILCRNQTPFLVY